MVLEEYGWTPAAEKHTLAQVFAQFPAPVEAPSRRPSLSVLYAPPLKLSSHWSLHIVHK